MLHQVQSLKEVQHRRGLRVVGVQPGPHGVRRIVAALGRSGARVREEKLALYVNDVCIMEDGLPIPFFKEAVVLQMQNPDVVFRLDLNLGTATATAWGCNLSEAYVTFNSAYTT